MTRFTKAFSLMEDCENPASYICGARDEVQSLGAVYLPSTHISQSHASSLLGKSFPDRGFTASFWEVFALCGHGVLLNVQPKSLLEWESSVLRFRVDNE